MQSQNHKGQYPLPVSQDAIRLAARLRASSTESEKIILFTGAMAREGVSTLATQVALALAQIDRGAVLLLDTNLRTPSLHTTFQVQQIPGLVDLIEHKATLEDAIHPTDLPTLSLLPVGNAHGDPLRLFPTVECATLMQTLREWFRFIIVDASPLLQYVDTTLLVPYTDGVIVAIAAGERRQAEVLEVKRVLDGLKASVIGVVLCERTRRKSR